MQCHCVKRAKEEMKAAQREVNAAWGRQKTNTGRKWSMKLRENNMREVWEGVRTITGHKAKTSTEGEGVERENDLNYHSSSPTAAAHTEDRLQFAYRAEVGVEDTILYLQHRANSHLDKGSGTVRILFLDFSSPGKTHQNVNGPLPGCLDFQLPHQQTVCQAEGHHVWHCGQQHQSSAGDRAVPPPLYSVHSRLLPRLLPQRSGHNIQKFSDDTAIMGCIRDDEEEEYRSLVRNFAVWCHTNNLQLNNSKTKELVIDFGRGRPRPVLLGAEEVEVVDETGRAAQSSCTGRLRAGWTSWGGYHPSTSGVCGNFPEGTSQKD